MGINGLLQQLKSISRPTHVSSYRGQKVAIDGYSWLHKGAYSCSRELCEGIWTDGYVRYFVSRVEMLLGNGVIPVVVFDGCRLPMKADEEESRRRGRREAMERARAHAESGNMAAATECYQRAVDIAPWMAKVVIEALRERGVTCLVAPYEADAQMSYLALRGDVHAVLTEDSDMLAYGCPRVLYKLDRGGAGEEILLADLPLVRELNMVGFDHDMLLQMCILAGCDFLPNISGVGIRKAHAMIRKHRDFTKAVKFLRFNGTSPPAGYEVRFQRTIWLFRHQRVFCPASRTLTHLRPLPPGGLGAADVLVPTALPPDGPERQELPFLGPPLEHSVAAGIASGDLDPSTLQPFDLVSIYRGCAYPPRHLRAVLQLPPLPSSQQQQQQQQLSRGASGDADRGQRRHSWGGGPGPTTSGGPTQSSNGPSQQHPHPHSHLHASQHLHHHHHRQGRQGGRPPMPPGPRGRGTGRGIERFFPSHPAASQPFRRVVSQSEGVPRDGAEGAAAGGLLLQQQQQQQLGNGASGLGGTTAPVVTLSGLPVELVAGGAARAAEGKGPAAMDAEEADATHPSPKRRRREGAAAAAPPSQASGLSAGGTGTAGAGTVSGSLFAHFGWGAGTRRRSMTGGAEPGSGPSQSGAAAESDGAGDEGGPAVSADASGGGSQSACARGLLRAQLGDGPADGHLAGPLGGGGGSQFGSQGFRRDWSSGAESDGQYDSQYDSQLTSGCEGAGRGRHGKGRLGGRSRAPAQLAYEALFSEPLGSGQLSQHPTSDGVSDGGFGPCGGSSMCPGPGQSQGTATGTVPAMASTQPLVAVAGPGRHQVLGALAALQSWRQGPAAPAPGLTAGSSQAPAASVSLPSPSKQSRPDPRPGECDAPLRAARTSPTAAQDVLGPSTAGVARQRSPRAPPQFSIYDLEEPDLRFDEVIRQEHVGSDSAAAVAPAAVPLQGYCALGGGADGHTTRPQLMPREQHASEGSGDEDEDEEEVTSPLKSLAATMRRPYGLQAADRQPGVGLRRRRGPGQQLPLLLHPSVRRRLSAGAAGPAACGTGCGGVRHPAARRAYSPSPRMRRDVGRETAQRQEAEEEGEEEGLDWMEDAGRVVPVLPRRRRRQPAVDGLGLHAGTVGLGLGWGFSADPRVVTAPIQRRPGRRWLDPTGAGDSEDCAALGGASRRRVRSPQWLGRWEGASGSQGLSPNRGQGTRAPGGGCPCPAEGEEEEEEHEEEDDNGFDGLGGSAGEASDVEEGEEDDDHDDNDTTRQLVWALNRSEARRRRRRGVRPLSSRARGGDEPAAVGLLRPHLGVEGGDNGERDPPPGHPGGSLMADAPLGGLFARTQPEASAATDGELGSDLQLQRHQGHDGLVAMDGGDGDRAGGCSPPGATGFPPRSQAAPLAPACPLMPGQQQQQRAPEAVDEREQGQEQQQQQQQSDRDEDEEDDVLITADVAAADASGFHSVRHVERFAQVARRAVDRMESTLQLPAARAMAPPSSQQHQQRPLGRSSQRGSQQQRSASVGGGFRPPGPVANAAAAKPSLADFAFVRAAPKRRASTGAALGPAAAGGGRRPSVFVQLDGSGAQEADLGLGLSKDHDHEPSGPLFGAQARPPQPPPPQPLGGEGLQPRGIEAEALADDSDDVEIVGVTDVVAPGDGGVRRGPLVHRGTQRQAMAEVTLRLPFQAPRAAGQKSCLAPRGGGAGGAKGGAAARSKVSGKEQQPRITDSFKTYAFKGGK